MPRSRRTRYGSTDTMVSIPQSPSSYRPRSRDTGFPEAFCGNRNTTLPHPDADLSPNASISADDISVAKVLHRSRLSFLAKNKRTISHGKITAQMEGMFSDAVLLDTESEPSPGQEKQNPMVHRSHGRDDRPSKDGGDSFARSSSSTNYDEEKPNSPSSPKRRSMLRKLGIHG